MTLPRPLPPYATHRDVAFFFDLDGTLAAIAPRPEDVELPPRVVAWLDRLTTAVDGAVAVLSGRPLDQVDALLAPLRLPAAGLHGGDLRIPGGRRLRCEPTPYVRGVVKGGLTSLSLPEGAWIEEKQDVAFALHYRQSPGAGPALAAAARRIAAQTHGAYRVMEGHCVVELCPAGRTKGTALRRLLGTKPFLGRVPIVLGDDLTDEDAFAEARLWGGASAVVGARAPSCADVRLADPEAARGWLRQAAEGMELSASDARLPGAA